MLKESVKEILEAKGLTEAALCAPINAWFDRAPGKNADGTVHSPAPTAAETSPAQIRSLIHPVLAAKGLLDWSDECTSWACEQYGVK